MQTAMLIVGVDVAVATVLWWQQLLSACAVEALMSSGPNVRKWLIPALDLLHRALWIIRAFRPCLNVWVLQAMNTRYKQRYGNI